MTSRTAAVRSGSSASASMHTGSVSSAVPVCRCCGRQFPGITLRAVWSTNDASEAGVRSRPRPGAPESSGETSRCAHRSRGDARAQLAAREKERAGSEPARRAPPRRRNPRRRIASARSASLQTAAIGSGGEATSWHSADFPAARQRVRRSNDVSVSVGPTLGLSLEVRLKPDPTSQAGPHVQSQTPH